MGYYDHTGGTSTLIYFIFKYIKETKNHVHIIWEYNNQLKERIQAIANKDEMTKISFYDKWPEKIQYSSSDLFIVYKIAGINIPYLESRMLLRTRSFFNNNNSAVKPVTVFPSEYLQSVLINIDWLSAKNMFYPIITVIRDNENVEELSDILLIKYCKRDEPIYRSILISKKVKRIYWYDNKLKHETLIAYALFMQEILRCVYMREYIPHNKQIHDVKSYLEILLILPLSSYLQKTFVNTEKEIQWSSHIVLEFLQSIGHISGPLIGSMIKGERKIY